MGLGAQIVGCQLWSIRAQLGVDLAFGVDQNKSLKGGVSICRSDPNPNPRWMDGEGGEPTRFLATIAIAARGKMHLLPLH